MTDKEERRLFPSMTEEEWRLLNFVELAILEWESLPLAPKHTDEECEVNRELIREMKVRIKELEELAPKHTDEEYEALEQALDEKSLCASCEKLWDGDACEWTCPHCQIKYLQSCIKELEELAPKHTDEEYEQNANAFNDIIVDQDEFIKTLESRIKELEGNSLCLGCGAILDRMAKERANKHTDDKPEG